MDLDLNKVKINLERKGYNVYLFKTKDEAMDFMDSSIDNKSVGLGGSMTLEEMKVFEHLSVHNTVYSHAHKIDNKTMDEIRRDACASEVYISSVNGLSMDGDIVNIDNTGNRVAAINYGPKDVYLVIGKNKIRKTLEDAISRAQNIAAPKNAQRLNRKTPCALNADRCYHCESADKICRILSVLMDKPAGQIIILY